MAGIVDSFNKMTITATSPDGNLRGTLTGGRRFTFGFRPGTFEDYSSGSAELQAGRLISELCAGVRTGSRKILDKHDVEVIESSALWDKRRRDYHSEVDQISVAGMSGSRTVRVSAMGDQVTVKLKPGTWDSMTEHSFTSELAHAATMMRTARKKAILDLKDSHFGIRSIESINPAHPAE